MKWDQKRDFEQRLLELAAFYGHEPRDGFYLFEAYDEVPDGFEIHESIDWMERFCEPCARKLIKDNGYDPDITWQDRQKYEKAHDGKSPPDLNKDSGPFDSPGWCPICGAFLTSSYTRYAEQNEIAAFEEDGPIRTGDLLAIHQLVENTSWGDLSDEVTDLATDCLTRLHVSAGRELAARNRATVATLGSAATAVAGLGRRIRVWMDRALDRTVED